MSSSSRASLFSLPLNSTVTVTHPLNPVRPTTALDAPSLIGVCADLFLDGSRTTGSGGRALTYNFSTSNTMGFENVTKGKRVDDMPACTNQLGILMPSPSVQCAFPSFRLVLC